MKKTLRILLFALVGITISAFVYVSIRQANARRDMDAEWQAPVQSIPELAVTSQLEIIPLYEASSTVGNTSGHGVSYLIRTDAATLLLDVGNNPDNSSVAPFMENMQALGIAWDEIDRIVISHPHPDHVGGTKAWWDRTVAMGDLVVPASLGERLIFVPVPVSFKGAIHATIPTLPSPDIATTGVLSYPEVFPLSLLQPKGAEQALVIHVAGQGLVIITGCGHPGLEKLVERAEMLYGQTVIGVVGGLHYLEATAQDVQPHIQFLQDHQVRLVALSPHDSGPQALEAFQSAFGENYHTLRVGEAIQFP